MIIPQFIYSATADWFLDHLEVLELMTNNSRVIPVMFGLGHAGMSCGWVWSLPNQISGRLFHPPSTRLVLATSAHA